MNKEEAKQILEELKRMPNVGCIGMDSAHIERITSAMEFLLEEKAIPIKPNIGNLFATILDNKKINILSTSSWSFDIDIDDLVQMRQLPIPSKWQSIGSFSVRKPNDVYCYAYGEIGPGVIISSKQAPNIALSIKAIDELIKMSLPLAKMDEPEYLHEKICEGLKIPLELNRGALKEITMPDGIRGYNCIACNTFCSCVEPNRGADYICPNCR